MKKEIKILAVGDVIGRPGRELLTIKLQGLIDVHRIDFVIVNGENAAGGRSITPEIAKDFFSIGVDVITSGNHIWDNNDVLKMIDTEKRLLRPANYPEGVPGSGYNIYSHRGAKICVINLLGRSGMEPVDCPFRKFDEIYEEVKDKSDFIIVDFHAETTSEKRALGWYLDGRASVVFGTHTHVQTADEEILPAGSCFITDIGMTGAFDSVIGMNKDQSLRKFLYRTKVRFEVASGNPKINAVIFSFDDNGKAKSINRIFE